MKQHKWHKEIKAWADGIDVEVRFADRKTYDDHWMIAKFDDLKAFDWNDAQWEFRIKPQPKEPKCKTHPDAPHGFCRDASHSEDRYVCECEFWEEPKEPQYLYVFATPLNQIILRQYPTFFNNGEEIIGKIKLEEND